MQVGVIPASAGAFPADGPTVQTLARRAEEVGFESIWIGEHVVMSSHETYPGSHASRVGPSPTSVLPDPIEWLTVAACTERMLLGTAIFLMPLHRPAIMAKRLATLDQLSSGRLRLGIGLGWSRDEYAAVGESYTTRGRRCDEAIDAVRTLWRESPATFHGDFVNFEEVNCIPQPVNGSIPILVGGDSDAAARRAGRLGNGYFPFGKDPEELARLIGIMRDAAKRAERDPKSIELTALGSARPEMVRSLAELGVTRMVMFLPDLSPAGVERLWDKARTVQRAAGI